MRNFWTDGVVNKGEVKYYFFPIDLFQQENYMILLNKTQIFYSGPNGNTKLYVNVQTDIYDSKLGLTDYRKWNYPRPLSDFISDNGYST